MQNKFLNIETAWTYPIIVYPAIATYVEVRKASGISYIILELILETENNKEKLSTTLKNFGVPTDIHYIFSDEISNMINHSIVEMKSNDRYIPEMFNDYVISDFIITELGRKLFADGTIPTGNDKDKKILIYYDPSTKNIQSKFNQRLFNISDSTIDEDSLVELGLKKDEIELFVNDNLDFYQLKKGEKVKKIQYEKEEYKVYKIEDDIELTVDSDGITFVPKDRERKEFVEKFYNGRMISEALEKKKKFCFHEKYDVEKTILPYPTENEIVEVLLPTQLQFVLSRNNQLSFSKHNEMKNSEYIVDSDFSKFLYEKYQLMGTNCYIDKEKMFQIIPARFNLRLNGTDETCEVNLIVTETLSDNKSTDIANEIFEKYCEMPISLENCSIISIVSKFNSKQNVLDLYTKKKLDEQVLIEHKVKVFDEINSYFGTLESWNEISNIYAKSLFDVVCREIDIETFSAKNSAAKKLNRIIKLDEVDFLSSLSRRLMEMESDELVFDAFEDLDYRTDTLLSVVNVFSKHLRTLLDGENIESISEFGKKLALMGNTFHELQKVTGIYDASRDVAEIDIDEERFMTLMSSFSENLSQMKKYRLFAIEEYDSLVEFLNRFNAIKEIIAIEREAPKNPNQIDEKYINNLINKGRYKDAICDMHVRLQYELNRLMSTEKGTTYDILTDKKIKKYLTNEEIQKLHHLRKCRNEFQHPSINKNTPFTEEDMNGWFEIIKKLGRENV